MRKRRSRIIIFVTVGVSVVLCAVVYFSSLGGRSPLSLPWSEDGKLLHAIRRAAEDADATPENIEDVVELKASINSIHPEDRDVLFKLAIELDAPNRDMKFSDMR